MSGQKRTLTGKHILVVEDEPTIRRFYDRLFESCELVTTFAPTGNAAMEAIESERDFDIILLDVRLPGLSGREIWKLLELKRPELRSRVVMVTGDILNETTRQLLEESGCPYLEKPFSTEELLSALDSVVTRPSQARSQRGKVIGE